MKTYAWPLALVALLPLGVCAQALSPEDLCRRVKAPGDIHVGKLVLHEAPDLATEELRDINSTITKPGCLGVAFQRFTEYQAKYPQDFTSKFVEARFAWRSKGTGAAKKLLEGVLEQHPGFASAYVLLGSVEMEMDRDQPAREHFYEALRLSPDDLWGYVNLRVLQANRLATPEIVSALVEVANSPIVPTWARESATNAVKWQSYIPPDLRESLHRSVLEYQSATPRHMKVENLARFLIEEKGEYVEPTELLTASLQLADTPKSRQLLAEAHLVHAASLDVLPSAKNAEWIAKAKELLGGDLSAVTAEVLQSERLKPLRPFVFGGALADPDARGRDGRTALCVAARALDEDAVAQLLLSGADPDAECEGWQALRMVVGNENDDLDGRRAIATLLLEKGADPTPAIVYCTETYPPCRPNFLTLLQKYAEHR